jgi:hypothetical protein
MRNLTNPIVSEQGTIETRGQAYHLQTISYGSRRLIHVFRKGELHRHGLVFTGQREYEMWKAQLGAQRELF